MEVIKETLWKRCLSTPTKPPSLHHTFLLGRACFTAQPLSALLLLVAAGGLPVPVPDRCSLAQRLQTRWRLFPVWVCAFRRSKETFFTPWKNVQREAYCTVLSGKRRKRGKLILFLFLSGWSRDLDVMVCDREFEVLLTCNYKHVLSTGRLTLRLIYISNYESE